MFLFSISDIITVPFGYLLDWLYQLTHNYGAALVIFAVVVKLVLVPIQAKGKKSTMKMSRLQPQIQALQKKYDGDPQRQSAAMQELYKREGVSMTGGCLWSFVPLLILLPLYTVIRQPLVYMLHESAENASAIVTAIQTAAPDLFGSNSYYHQLVAARHISEFVEVVKEAVPTVAENTLKGVDFTLFSIDLGSVPSFNIFSWDAYDWAHIGAFLIPCLSAGSQVFSMWISQKMNNSVVTNEKGVQDEETAKKSEANKSMGMMMWIMPLMSLWIGFTVPAALSLYWFTQGIISIVQDVYLTKHYRKIYDAEDAVKLARAMEEEAAEAEKERIRAARRAANPEGITENTSRKKLQKQQQNAQSEAKAAAAREYAVKKGIAPEGGEENAPLSGIAERPFCRGRNYDPSRYSRVSTEE